MAKYEPLKNCGKFYEYWESYDHIVEACQYADFKESKRKENDETISYLNVPAGFDIETTSMITKDGIKIAWMYHWQFCINGVAVKGRTWEEWEEFINELAKRLNLDFLHRMLIFVHNLAYDFQFFRKHISVSSAFALDTRRPVKVICNEGFEFRCSYILSGYKLEKVGEMLPNDVRVLKENGEKYDYKKIRHPNTPMKQHELDYCEMDVRVICAYIYDKMRTDGDVTKILLTKTGYVRQYVKRNTIQNPDKKKRNNYKKLIQSLTIQQDEYEAAHRAFAGGFTHAAPEYLGDIVFEVDSIDFTSSYPTVMIAELYPMSKGIKIDKPTKKEISKYTRYPWLSIFNIKIEGLRPLRGDIPDHIISVSKCYTDRELTKSFPESDALVSNGRIVYTKRDVYTTITSVDFEEYQKFYDWDSVEIYDMWYYKAAPLPSTFVECIIYFYKLKTELKGKKGREVEYQWAKEMLNSLYGMCACAVIRPEILYTLNEWDETEDLSDSDKQDQISEYNSSQSRFLSYIWAPFVTAYARRNVYSGILEFGNTHDYLYCDTDSNKVTNLDKHKTYIDNYNKNIVRRLKNMCKLHGLNPDDIEPEDVDDVKHPLGVWDHETAGNQYTRFITLGAKRYLVEQLDKIEDKDESGKVIGYHKELRRHMTVAGLPKSAIDKMEKRAGKDGFEIFSQWDYDDRDNIALRIEVMPEDTGKSVLTYVDREMEADVIDYTGDVYHVSEKSYVYMEDASFDFGPEKNFMDYIMGLKTEKSY